MTQTVRKENSKPINVILYGIKSPVFEQYQQQLQAIGYHLRFESKVTSVNQDQESDICIVDAAELEPCGSLLQKRSLPFLIYGIQQLPNDEKALDIVYDAVGYFTDEPSANSLCLNIQLGLHRHRERELYFKRAKDISEKIENNRLNGIATGLLMSKTGLGAEEIFDEIKALSRRKQQRVSDVANEVIQVLSRDLHSTESKTAKSKPILNLTLWLEGNICSKSKQ